MRYQAPAEGKRTKVMFDCLENAPLEA